MTANADKTVEVRRNFDAFIEQLPQLFETHAGKFALLRHSEVVRFFDTARDAMIYGTDQFPDAMFSVQEVTDAVFDLGWFSHAPTHAAV